LGSKYGDIMDKVEVTAEMRRRIIRNIENYDFQRRALLQSNVRKRRYAALAGCLVLVLFAAIAIPKFMAQNTGVTDNGGTPVTTFSSINELSQSVGFTVKDINYLPFKVSKTKYADNDGMAEITYKDSGKNNAVYRISKGNEDNSGDYTDYGSTVKTDIDGSTVTLKGDDGTFALGIWNEGKLSYSIALSKGINKAGWQKMIESIR